MIERSTNGTLPVGTRLVEFTLTTTAASNSNNASADNLSFVLAPRPDPPLHILGISRTNAAWQVEFEARTNRFYTLEVTADLSSWNPLSTPVSGIPPRMVLFDTNATVGTTFYRVRCNRPSP